MTFTSSIAAFFWMPNFAVYSGTKAHNAMLAKMLNQALFKSAKTNGLIDLQSLHPAGVSTNLNNFMKVGGDIVTAYACVKGSLSDLGQNKMNVFGATPHAVQGGLGLPLVNWSPHFQKQVGFKASKNPHIVMQD